MPDYTDEELMMEERDLEQEFAGKEFVSVDINTRCYNTVDMCNIKPKADPVSHHHRDGIGTCMSNTVRIQKLLKAK